MSEALQVGSGLEVPDVDALRVRLLAALDAGGALQVDLSAIVTVDTAGVQLLLALQAEAAYRGVPVVFAAVPTALAAVLDVLGLGARLGGADHGP